MLHRLCLLVVCVFWLLWLGLLAIANTIACASIYRHPLFPIEWTYWLLPRARYAHGRCRAYYEEQDA